MARCCIIHSGRKHPERKAFHLWADKTTFSPLECVLRRHVSLTPLQGHERVRLHILLLPEEILMCSDRIQQQNLFFFFVLSD